MAIETLENNDIFPKKIDRDKINSKIELWDVVAPTELTEEDIDAEINSLEFDEWNYNEMVWAILHLAPEKVKLVCDAIWGKAWYRMLMTTKKMSDISENPSEETKQEFYKLMYLLDATFIEYMNFASSKNVNHKKVYAQNYNLLKSKFEAKLNEFGWFAESRMKEQISGEKVALDESLQQAFTKKNLDDRFEEFYWRNKNAENAFGENVVTAEINLMYTKLTTEPNADGLDYISSVKKEKIVKLLGDVKWYPNNVPAEKVTEESAETVKKLGYKLAFMLEIWSDLNSYQKANILTDEQKTVAAADMLVVEEAIDDLLNSYGQ